MSIKGGRMFRWSTPICYFGHSHNRILWTTFAINTILCIILVRYRYYVQSTAHVTVQHTQQQNKQNLCIHSFCWQQYKSYHTVTVPPSRSYCTVSRTRPRQIECVLDWPYFIKNTSSHQCVLSDTWYIGIHRKVHFTTHLVLLGSVNFWSNITPSVRLLFPIAPEFVGEEILLKRK
jgi:hypothetical protein